MRNILDSIRIFISRALWHRSGSMIDHMDLMIDNGIDSMHMYGNLRRAAKCAIRQKELHKLHYAIHMKYDSDHRFACIEESCESYSLIVEYREHEFRFDFFDGCVCDTALRLERYVKKLADEHSYYMDRI